MAKVINEEDSNSCVEASAMQPEVSKIEVVPQFQRLLVLCGGRLTVHDLHSLTAGPEHS